MLLEGWEILADYFGNVIISLVCSNNDCERIILTVDDVDDIPEHIHCNNCELLEKDKYEFTKDEVTRGFKGNSFITFMCVKRKGCKSRVFHNIINVNDG
jgi:hypothetical protein